MTLAAFGTLKTEESSAMRTIQLTQGQFAIVDDIWYEYLMQWRWYAKWNKNNQTFYAMRKEHGQMIRMHRVIAYAPRHIQVDHIDHIGTHNWIINLRWATQAQQNMNQRKRLGTSSKYKGVHWRKEREKWCARISCNGKHIYLKLCDDEIEAAMVYDESARRLFGEFAYLNFPG